MKTLKLTGITILTASLFACGNNENQKPETNHENESNEIVETEINEEAPATVQAAFAKKFTTATGVEWGKENETEWEAEFEMNGKEYSANYNADGTWKETESKIEKSEIPANIQQTLDTEFSEYEMEEAEISETIEGTVYEFELETEETAIEVAISNDGMVLKKEVLNDENDEADNDEDENEREIKTSEIPQNIIDAINSKYADAELVEADEVTQEDGSLTYDVEIKVNGEKSEVMYDANAKFLGIEQDDDDNEDEGDYDDGEEDND